MFKKLRSAVMSKRWSLVQDLEADLHNLRYLFWESTRRCNLSCLHCGSDCGKDEGQPDLESEVVLAALSGIADRYDAREIMLVVTGGEPLVRPDLLDVMGTAGELGFKLGMVTNGYTLTEARARELRDVGLRSVVVSLDGPREVHDWLRDRAGSFERAGRALEALRAVRVPIVEAITCVTPRLLDRMDETYALVTGLDATHWRVFNIFPAGRARDNADVLLDEDGIRQLVETMARLRVRGKADGLVVNLSEEGYLGWDWEDRVRDTPYFCRAGINIAGIMVDGAIAACPNLSPWMAQGNLREDDFVDVWEHRYELFRDRSWTREGACGDCKQWSVCRGNSLHLWDRERQQPCWCHHEILNG